MDEQRRRSFAYQPVASAVQRLHVELLLAASTIASASRSSFFCALTYGRTYSGDVRRTV